MNKKKQKKQSKVSKRSTQYSYKRQQRIHQIQDILNKGYYLDPSNVLTEEKKIRYIEELERLESFEIR